MVCLIVKYIFLGNIVGGKCICLLNPPDGFLSDLLTFREGGVLVRDILEPLRSDSCRFMAGNVCVC